ncbi:MAG: peptide ABC transporter substrate-binding protein [Patescibacteria group bacterium]
MSRFKTLFANLSATLSRWKHRRIQGRVRHADKRLVRSLRDTRLPNLKQWKYIAHVLSGSEKKAVLILAAVAALAGTGAVSAFVASHSVLVPDFGGEYVEGAKGTARTVNPVLAQNDTDLDLVRLVYSGLFATNERGELVPDVANDFSVTSDGLTYTVHLRENIRFHDGTPLTAEDVLFTIQLIQDPEIRSPLRKSFASVVASKVDDRTLTLTLKEPFAPFPTLLTVGILPAHLWRDIPPASLALAEYNLKPVGSGPFRFQSFLRDKRGTMHSYTLVRNETYYGQKAYLEKITFRLFPDWEGVASAVRSRAVTGASFLPNPLRDSVAKLRGITVHQVSLPQITAIFLNLRNDSLQAKRVRQALLSATDKYSLATDALDSEAVIHGPILPGELGYDQNLPEPVFDPGRARELLDAEGWKLGSDSDGRKKGDQTLEISLATADRPEYISAAELVATMWEDVGVKTELRVVPAGEIRGEILKPRSFDALLYGVIVGGDPDPYPFWHSSQADDPGLNLSGFRNRDADRLLEEARSATTTEVRADRYKTFQSIVAENIPAIFLANPHYSYLVSSKIRGVNLQRITNPASRFAQVTEWYRKTKRVWKQ